jgi:outer membrane receptor protein involved in Fe transport
MTHRLNSTRHKGSNPTDRSRGRRLLRYAPLASAISAILAGMPVAHADTTQTADTNTLEEVVVTAQKKTENLQDVPISISVFDTQKMEQLNIVDLDDYVKYSPSVSYVRSQGQGGNGQPGESHVYMRGVVSGGDGNHSGSQPSVGTYLDEQPVTTIDGTVDVHLYDIQRIEVLEGPQGTLYGASSEAGTIRIITNKPDPSKFEAGYDLSGDKVDHGGPGYEAEGFVNIPLSPISAIRLVGWDEHDGGYINNVAGTNANGCIQNGVRTFPTWAGVPNSYPAVTPCPAPGVIGAGAISNAASVQNDYNTVDTRGGRAALKLDLGDNWTISPTVMGQSMNANGFFGYDPAVGDLDLVHFGPENSQDSFMQSALTIDGHVSNFDITYAGAYMKRTTHSIADYSDYSEFYDRVYGSGSNWVGNNGKPIMPQEYVIGKAYFEKWSHEIRVSTPQDEPVKATVGAFMQRQLHDIWQDYTMPGYDGNPYLDNAQGFAQSLSIPTLNNNTIWLTDQQRIDRDKAVFFQGTWDISSQWSLNGGLRYYEYDNSLEGFYGYSAAYDQVLNVFDGDPATHQQSGVDSCFAPASTRFAPCTDLDKTVSATGTVPRVNLTYKFTPDKMVYATYSKGFRPGGVNRTSVAGIGPYQADFLTNYEVGWKTQWFGERLRWNGALFWEDWKNFQFSFLGPNSLTIIANGGDARIKGIENEIEWQATSELMLSTSFTFLDPVLTQNYCGQAGVTSCPDQQTPNTFGGPTLIGPLAPAGTNLPVSPKFKGNVVARYAFDEVNGWKPFAQASFVYQTQTAPLLLLNEVQNVGMQPAYGLLDLAAGAHVQNMMIQVVVTNATDKRAELTRFAQTNPVNDNQPYIIPEQPRTVYIKFGQKF